MSFYRLGALMVVCLLVIPGTLFILPDEHAHPAGVGLTRHIHVGDQIDQPILTRGVQVPLIASIAVWLHVLPLIALLGSQMAYNILQPAFRLRPFALSPPVPPPR